MTKVLRFVAILMTGVLLLAACGSDDGDSADDAATDESTDDSTSDDTTSDDASDDEMADDDMADDEMADDDMADDDMAEGEPVAFCTDFLTANTQVVLMETPAGDPEAMVAAVEAALASAPEEIQADVATMAAFAQSGGEGDPEEFDAAQGSVLAWVSDNCGLGEIEATAVEYMYQDFPTSVDAGPATITLNNEGEELHEAVVLKLNDGVDLTAEELLALPEEEILPQVTIMGAAFAEPGSSGQDIFDLSEPGSYVVACFIPVGTTAEAIAEAEAGGAEPEGPPHFTQGMFAEFTVG